MDMDLEEEVDYDFDSPEKAPPPKESLPTEDIYGDLYDEHGEGETLLKSRYAALEEKCKGLEIRVEELQNQLSDALKEKEALQETKRILTRNISCLYRTAKEDVERLHGSIAMKNEEILRLQLRNKAPNASNHRSPNQRSPIQPQPGKSDATQPISPDFGREKGPQNPQNGIYNPVPEASAYEQLDF